MQSFHEYGNMWRADAVQIFRGSYVPLPQVYGGKAFDLLSGGQHCLVQESAKGEVHRGMQHAPQGATVILTVV